MSFDLALQRSLALAEREGCENSLLKFLELGWQAIDPARFISSWHLEAIAEHLQAVTDGHVQRLVINVPPRTSKSSLCSVAWPAWTWAQSRKGPLSGPQVQFLSTSYAYNLSLRDSVKTRRLIQCPWFQAHWGNRFQLTSDVNTKHRFENDKGGYRLATSVDGMVTGEGGDVILVDDPHRAGRDAVSEVVRENTLVWWDEVMSTRLNDMATGAFVIVMQRLHQQDLTGHVLSKSSGYVHLMLPMEYDSGRRCSTYVQGEKFWEEPRQEDGELLDEIRFPPQEVARLKENLGSYGSAGQLQQATAPRGGGHIKDEWWRHWTEIRYPQCEFVVGSLDTAYTEKSENDYSALSIWGVFRHNADNVIPLALARQGADAIERWYLAQNMKVILLYQWQERLNFPDLVKKVMESCTLTPSPLVTTKYRFKIDRLLIENKAAGISVSQELWRQFAGADQFGVELIDPRKHGDKVARLLAVQHLFETGVVYVPWTVDENGSEVPNGYSWVEAAMDQVGVFPRGEHDDFVDSCSMALRWLRDSNLLLRPEEHARDVTEEFRYHSRSQPLYPA